MTTGKKILAVVLSIVLVLVGCGVVYVFGIRASIAGDDLDASTLSTAKLPRGTVNYALFGVDARAGVDGDRSDTIMIVSVNYKSGKITTTSIQRDTLVRIPKSKKYDETYTKINAAYSYGGPRLAVKTINENFDMNITDYVTVGFESMQQVVDTLGGVTVNITDESVVTYTNKYIDESVPDHSQDVSLGKNKLNGLQALAYSRNRYSDNDFGRAKRQRQIFRKIFTKLKKADTLTLISLVTKIYPYIKTSLSMNEITSFAQGYMNMDHKRISGGAIPVEGKYTFMPIGGADTTIPVTLADNATALHQMIYGENVSYTPSATVDEISDAIVARTGAGTYTGSAGNTGTYTTGTDGTTQAGYASQAGTGNTDTSSANARRRTTPYQTNTQTNNTTGATQSTGTTAATDNAAATEGTEIPEAENPEGV